MNIILSQSAEELGYRAADMAAGVLNEAIAKNGLAYLLLSTGMSQFTTFEALLKVDVDWSKVEMFHLDEYINLPQGHQASFVKYLKERFTSHVPLKAAHYIEPDMGLEAVIEKLSNELTRKPIDLGLIGIGENTHIAFNDPPADFEDDRAFKVVELDEDCRRQQFTEAWFSSMEEVPKTAITMTVKQILKCKKIISAVPYKVKAEAVRKTLTAEKPTGQIPATALFMHPDVSLFLDADSASLIDEAIIARGSAR